MNPLFSALVDDAGLFPPTRLPMAAALRRHRADLNRNSPVLTHRFLCPASRFGEMTGLLDGPVRVGLIVDGPLRLVNFPDVTVELRELRLTPGDDLPDPGGPARTFVEYDRGPAWLDAVAALAGTGLGAKVRCGGVKPELFPEPEELAAFIHTCARAGVPFKATAGLHNAVRHFDAELGVHRHGFLNLLMATCTAVGGGDVADISRVLSLTDREPLVRRARAVRDDDGRRARELFVSYGSCSTGTPLEDLRALDLIGRP